jgi:hypothetical protein
LLNYYRHRSVGHRKHLQETPKVVVVKYPREYVGAVRRVYSDDDRHNAFMKLRRRLGINAYDNSAIYSYNDAPERTFEEVQSLVKELGI